MINFLFLFILIASQSYALTIGVIGDSIGMDSPYTVSFSTYLRQEFECDVVNDSQSGTTTELGSIRVRNLIDNFDVDVIIMCLGFNDLVCKINPEQTLINITKMIHVAKKRHVPIYIGVVDFQVYENDYAYEYHRWYDRSKKEQHEQLKRFSAIYELIKQRGFVCFPFLTEEIMTNHSYDFVHPRSSGSYLICKEILKLDFLRK